MLDIGFDVSALVLNKADINIHCIKSLMPDLNMKYALKI